MNRTARTLLAALLIVMVAASGCADERPVRRLSIATGGAGGVYETLGRALAEELRRRWNIEVEVHETAGSGENLRLIAEGVADVGFASLDVAALATTGAQPFPEPLPVVALMRLYDQYLQVVVDRKAALTGIDDLEGHPVSVGLPDSGTELLAVRMLEAARVNVAKTPQVRESGTRSAAALRSGRVNGFFIASGLPAPAIEELARTMPIDLLPAEEYLPRLQAEHGGVYSRRLIPANTYQGIEEVPTVGVPTLLMAGSAMSASTARWLTRVVFSLKSELLSAHGAARRLDERSAVSTSPIPLHPGSVCYYRETKPFLSC